MRARQLFPVEGVGAVGVGARPGPTAAPSGASTLLPRCCHRSPDGPWRRVGQHNRRRILAPTDPSGRATPIEHAPGLRQAATVDRSARGGQRHRPCTGRGDANTEIRGVAEREQSSVSSSQQIDAPMVVKGLLLVVADRPGSSHSVEGRLLLGHAPAGRGWSRAADRSFIGQQDRGSRFGVRPPSRGRGQAMAERRWGKVSRAT